MRQVKTLGQVLAALKAERDENTCREDFRPTEALAIGERLVKMLKPEAEKRREATQGRPKKGAKKTGGKLPPVSKTRDAVGEAVGMSGSTYANAKAMLAAADADPSLRPIVVKLDETGSVAVTLRSAIAGPSSRFCVGLSMRSSGVQ